MRYIGELTKFKVCPPEVPLGILKVRATFSIVARRLFWLVSIRLSLFPSHTLSLLLLLPIRFHISVSTRRFCVPFEAMMWTWPARCSRIVGGFCTAVPTPTSELVSSSRQVVRCTNIHVLCARICCCSFKQQTDKNSRIWPARAQEACND